MERHPESVNLYFRDANLMVHWMVFFIVLQIYQANFIFHPLISSAIFKLYSASNLSFPPHPQLSQMFPNISDSCNKCHASSCNLTNMFCSCPLLFCFWQNYFMSKTISVPLHIVIFGVFLVSFCSVLNLEEYEKLNCDSHC